MWSLTVRSRNDANKLLTDKHPFTALVTISASGGPLENREAVPNWYHFDFADVHVPMRLAGGFRPPSPQDAEDLIDIARNLRDDDHVLVHCAQGISRSTAAAYIMACTTLGAGREFEAWLHVVDARPQARPNRLLVIYGEQALQRGDNMTRVLTEVGCYR